MAWATVCRSLIGVGTAITAAAALAPSDLPATSAGGCGAPGYAYAGVQHETTAHGIRAVLTQLRPPAVEHGHVGAWIGLGGPDLGPNGTDSWIQVGISTFSFSTSNVYVEVQRPGLPRVYRDVKAIAPGERVRLAVLETAEQKDSWRVWLNGAPVSQTIHLPASSGRWRPIATTETWHGATRSCNRFAYRFERLEIATAPGGGWAPFRAGYTYRSPGYFLLGHAEASFTASNGRPPALRPPTPGTGKRPGASPGRGRPAVAGVGAQKPAKG